MAKPNVRLIVTIAALGAVLLFAAALIGIGYFQATSQSIGKFAPIGDPTNIKTK